MKINRNVIAVLAVAGLAVFLVAPNAIGAVVPLLFLAACPLSMIWMMWAMSGGRSTPTPPAVESDDVASLRAEVERLRADRRPTPDDGR